MVLQPAFFKGYESPVIKQHILGGVLRVRTQVDHHLLATLQACQPVQAPAQHLDLLCHAGLHPNLRGRRCRLPLIIGDAGGRGYGDG